MEISLATRSVFPPCYPVISAAWPSWVISQPLWWLSLSNWILSKALGTSQGGFFLSANSFSLTYLHNPPFPTFICLLFSNFCSLSMCKECHIPAPRTLCSTLLFFSAKCWSSFAMRTDSCQAKAAALTALEVESRKYNPGNMSTKQ